MTENEVIYCLKAESERYSELCEECSLYGEVGCDHCYEDATDMAVKALEEIQAYREIGTVEEIQLIFSLCKDLQDVIKQYERIGTIEELKALKEKSVAKKPLLRLCGDCQRDCIDCDRYEDRCPNCNGGLYVESGKLHEYCPHCGQKLDWQWEEKMKMELIKRQDAIDAVAQSYRYESDRMTALQNVPAITEQEIRNKAIKEFAEKLKLKYPYFVEDVGFVEANKMLGICIDEIAEQMKGI